MDRNTEVPFFETQCTMFTADVACQSHQYGCINGRCIYKEWMCDGVEDCPLGDDELPSLCSKFILITARRYASAGLLQRRVCLSVRLSVCHTPVL